MAYGDDDLHCCFIIQATPPYHYDFNQILALPSGFKYHNRYSTTWIDRNLLGNILSLRGRRVLLIMRDKEQNHLVPARWALIDFVQPIGDIVYFEYSLGDIVDYGDTPALRGQQIAGYTAILKEHHPELPGIASRNLTTPSVFLSSAGNQFRVAAASDLRHWGNVVQAVGTAAIYAKVDFLKIVELRTRDPNRAARLVADRYEVSPDTVYALRVFQYMPNFGDGRVTPHEIHVSTYPDHVASLRSRQRAVGKYDMLTFDIKVLDLPAFERTSIDISHEASYAPGMYASGSIYIPLLVRRRPAVVWLLLSRILVAAGLSALIFHPQFVPADPQLVRNLANVLFVLVVAGLGWTLNAIWPEVPWR